MFTGIIEEIGTILSSSLTGGSGELKVLAGLVLGDAKLGDSIAVNGVCLTITCIAGAEITFDVSAETLRRSNLGVLKRGERVNLERAMAADGRFGGHMVSGHIDGTGTLVDKKTEGNAVIFTINAPPNIMHYLIEKGSIAIDGISLTVASLEMDNFSIAVIPHSLKQTTLGKIQIGTTVNLENDLVAKYIEKLSRPQTPTDDSQSNLSLDTLQKYGFA
ncbi:riboflavin synthase [bacterium]|nr:riboflavin synthase [bacterium]